MQKKIKSRKKVSSKKKTSKGRNNLPFFVLSIFAFTVYFLSIVWIKNECMEEGRQLDGKRTEFRQYSDEKKVLESKVKYLLGNNRIMNLAEVKFGLELPVPESKIIVVENR